MASMINDRTEIITNSPMPNQLVFVLAAGNKQSLGWNFRTKCKFEKFAFFW
jgi:hypothetical protein